MSDTEPASDRRVNPPRGSDERLIKKLAPCLQILRTIAAASIDVNLGVVTGIAVGNHFKKSTSRLKGDKKEHALGVEGCVDITPLSRWSHPVEHPERGMVEIALGSHPFSFLLLSTVTTAQPHHQDEGNQRKGINQGRGGSGRQSKA